MAIDKKIQPTENDIVIDQYASSPIEINIEGHVDWKVGDEIGFSWSNVFQSKIR